MMVVHDTRSEAEIWRKRLFDVIDLCASLEWQVDREDFYQKIAERLCTIMKADVATIRLLSNTENSFVVFARSGDFDSRVFSEYSVLSVSTGRMPELMEEHEPIVFDFANPQEDDVDWERGVVDGFRTAITVPLVSGSEVEGVCDFLFRKPCELGQGDLDWIRGIGKLLGAILTNAMFSEDQINMRISEERHRLASEIHDNLSQSVNFIAFEAGNIGHSLAEGDLDLMKSQVSRLSKASDEAVKMLRSEMFQLQNVSRDGEIAMADIKARIDMLSRQWGFSYDFTLEGCQDDSVIPGRIGTQVIRILNEAFANIIRHAKATYVQVVVVRTVDSLFFSIADNGQGFDVDQVPRGKMGLAIMRERAMAINGEVGVESQVGKGTTVHLSVPHLV